MARRRGRILPFRIPFFRIFYSTTYTVLFGACLFFLAITPFSLIWAAIQNKAYQYIFMIGGVYVLTALLSIFIYSSRIYTSRTVLAGVGKAYIPVEDGEVGRSVRKLIVKQMERSAIVAWESRPRDLVGEILVAEQTGILPPETQSVGHNDYTVGRLIPVDPARPPWGHVEHAGWSSPSHRDANKNPNVQFVNVLAELPNLVEARAVSLAPPAISAVVDDGGQVADPAVVHVLRRRETMGMRDYLTQLSYLGLINPPEVGHSFLRLYEKVRFCGDPATEHEFERLMTLFADLLAGMTELSPEIVEEIRMRAMQDRADTESASFVTDEGGLLVREPSRSAGSRTLSPVTARTAPSRNVTPYLQQETPSVDSFSSVIHNMPDEAGEMPPTTLMHSETSSTGESQSLTSVPSDAGSVFRHSTGYEDD